MRAARRTTGACLALALLAAAGCGKSHDDTSGVEPSDDVAATVPAATQDVDRFTWNLPGGEPSTLDPVRIYGGSDLLVEANLCESLLTLTPTGSVEPGLAASIDQPDDTTYVVHLREGIEFSDGTVMTADDVVFSMERIRDGSYWGFFAENVDTISATDDLTVTITMTKPDAIFYRMLATPMAQVVEKDFVEQAGDQYGSPNGGIMCTGPYTVKEWNQGDSLVLAANDGWWQAADNPQRAAEVAFTFVTEDSTITSALLNGDIDGSFDIPFSSLSRLADSPDGSVYIGPSTKQLILIPTQLDGGSPLSDPLVREALAKSIDYDGLLNTTLANVAEPLRAVVPPGTWGSGQDVYDAAYDKLPVPTQDLDGARDLLEQAGVDQPAITLAVPAAIPEYVALAETIQSNAREAGFDVTLKPMPTADFSALYGNEKARDGVDAFLTDYYADIPDPTELYMQIGIPGGAADFGGYDNPDVAALLEEARGTSDDDARAELTAQAQATLTEDLVWLPLAYPLQTVYLSDRLGGATTAFPEVMYAPWLPSIGGR